MNRNRTTAIALIASAPLVFACSGDRSPTDPIAESSVRVTREVLLARPDPTIAQFGTSADDFGHAVAADRVGVAVAGTTYGTFTGETTAGGADAFVKLYSADGVLLWTRQFGTSESDEALGVAIDRTGVVVVGRTSGALAGATNRGGYDVFVRKYDLAGNTVWTTQLGSSGDDAAARVVLDRANVVVAGTASGHLSNMAPGAGGTDAFALQIDALTGAVRWIAYLGGASDDTATGVAADRSGVYVAVSTLGTLPAGPPNVGNTDAFAVKLDPVTGATLWLSHVGSSGADDASGIALTNGAVVLVGNTSGTLTGSNAGQNDVFAIRFDPTTGAITWTAQFGTAAADVATQVVLDRTRVFIAGATDGTFPGETSSGGTDALLAALDLQTGGVVSTSQFGTSGTDIAEDAAVDRKGIFAVGRTSGALAGQTSSGGFDAWYRVVTP